MRRLQYSIVVLIFALGAVHAGTATGIDIARSNTEPLEVGTVLLSPSDTYLNTNKKTYSTSTTLPAYTWPDRKVANAIVMKFNLAAIPAGSIVTSATLQLSLVASDTSAVDPLYAIAAHKIVGKNPNIAKATGYSADGVVAWTANTCCQGVPMAQADLAPASDVQLIDKTTGIKSWTITTMVQEWLANPASNRGLLLNADTTKPRDRYRSFASMEHPTASLRPVLKVTFAAADVTAPAVSITSPQAGAVSGNVTLTANASDNVAVAGVQFKLNGVPLGPELTAYPYTMNWDSTSGSDGSYSITAVAKDTTGNMTTSTAVAAMVTNGVLLFAPQDTTLNINAGNHNADPVLMAYTWPDFRIANAMLMKFDLSAMPPGSVVQEAGLFLALVQSDTMPEATYDVAAHKVVGKNPIIAQATGYNADAATSWSPSACCHDSVPLAQADISQAYATVAVDKTPGYKAWNITSMVQEWLANPSTNFGVVLNSDASKAADRFRSFASIENTDATLRPVLRVTYSAAGDTTAPVLANVNVSGVAATTATINWTTDEAANSQVEYGATSAYGSASPLDASMTSGHSVTLSNLSSGTQYHFRVRSRDQSGNAATSGDFMFTTIADAPPPPPPPPSGGIAALYPGDAGIESDPNVVFVERFDESSLANLFGRWTDVLNGAAMSITNDAPAGSPVGKSLTIPWSAGNSGGHLYRQLPQGVDDTLYVRYYVKHPAVNNYQHSGIWMGGYNPPLGWPNPQAGTKPAGNDRFSAAAEQNGMGRFDHYNYWMGMHQSNDGNYWGNHLLNNASVQASADQWMCVEQMVKLNAPVTSSNGEHAIWINGVKVSHVGQGFPNGSWSGGIFTQDPSGTPFQGIQWRNNSSLNLNWLWLQVYASNGSGAFKYAHVVAAKSYIGCLEGAVAPPPPPPPASGAWPNEPTGLTMVTDWAMDQALPVSGDVAITGAGGWKIVQNAAPGSSRGWTERVLDPSAPSSPSNVYDFVYPANMVEGNAPSTIYYDGLSADEVYAGFWWKPSSPFDYGPNGNKIAFIFNGGGGAGGQQFLILHTDGRLHVLPEYPGDYVWRTPNINPTVVTLGQWHRIEWYTNRVTGVLKWWLDGVLQGSYANVTNTYKFDMFQFSPTWGGNIGARKKQTDHYWFDHARISKR